MLLQAIVSVDWYHLPSPPWDVPQASPSVINQAFRSHDATLIPITASSTISSPFSLLISTQFAHFSFLLTVIPLLCTCNPHTQLGFKPTWRKCFNFSSIAPVIASDPQKSSSISLHVSKPTPTPRNSSLIHLDVAQFALPHHNSTRCASNCLKLPTCAPKLSKVASKCVELIVDRYIYLIYAYYSLQSSPIQLDSLLLVWIVCKHPQCAQYLPISLGNIFEL